MSEERTDDDGYAELVAEGLTTPFEGWDFRPWHGRLTDPEDELPWSYEALVRERLPRVTSLLDLGTGGGEFLSSLAPLPARTAATEGYPPNVPVARRRLEPLGVEVAALDERDDDGGGGGDGAGGELPFPDGSFDLVISRHTAYHPDELRRVLTDDGVFVTQQVGGLDLAEINEALGAPEHAYHDFCRDSASRELVDAGWTVDWSAEARVPERLPDIGALVLFLRLTPWHVPDFDVARYDAPLRELHRAMRAGRPLEVSCHRFALVARPNGKG
ncbi:methyltransferase domain-containing protein [Streptomyces sp. 3MP-14]|uniref:Methyltransferase domain-containing protein n=1 Tax=Streptomyces mimosae TaxID=2586635 RepID=A0A5N6A1H2_9ACTN|nr:MULTISPECIES: class I SAM-dependent methyltransferase [Streptomyces]KAB8161188.1 methyltransferase domain-containing protein [Streptomyces mimosae]KAB8178999.1 methyltransferase domain-containing protein [Streptomyces sp. 3MP-14]